jgi:hypothetical protein
MDPSRRPVPSRWEQITGSHVPHLLRLAAWHQPTSPERALRSRF